MIGHEVFVNWISRHGFIDALCNIEEEGCWGESEWKKSFATLIHLMLHM